MCPRIGAGFPDAAKPQHFCLEVEARFRDSSRSMHGFAGDLRRRKPEPCAPDLRGGNRSRGNAACDLWRESATNLNVILRVRPDETGAAHRRNHMHTWLAVLRRLSSLRRSAKLLTAALTLFLLNAATALAQPSEAAGEANLRLPDLSSVSFLGMTGHNILLIGILFCFFGLLFGLAIYMQLKNLPVHRSMREISELIYETCKTYLITQGKFILILWAFIAVVIIAYFGWLAPVPGKPIGVTVPVILAFSLLGIAGSYGVAWFGIRVNTFANSRTAFAGLRGKPYPIYAIPLKAGMSIGMMLISVELLIMLCILL